MEKDTIRSIFKFLENEENIRAPFMWKWLNNEPLTEDDLHINGDLDLTYSNIESLPEGLNVSGDLILTFCENNKIPIHNKNGSIYQQDLLYQNILKLYYYREYQLSDYSIKEDTFFKDYINENQK